MAGKQPSTLLHSCRLRLFHEGSTKIDSRKLFVSKIKNLFVFPYSTKRESATK